MCADFEIVLAITSPIEINEASRSLLIVQAFAGVLFKLNSSDFRFVHLRNSLRIGRLPDIF